MIISIKCISKDNLKQSNKYKILTNYQLKMNTIKLHDKWCIES